MSAAALPDKIKEIRETLQEKLKTLPDFGFGIRDKFLKKGTSTQTQGILSQLGQGPIRRMIQGQTMQAGRGGLIKGFQGKRILQPAPSSQVSGHITDVRRTKGPAAGAAVEDENYPSSGEIAVEL